MALTITVAKKSVSKVQDGLWNVTLNLICSNAGTEVINRDFSVKYRVGDSIPFLYQKFLSNMQAVIAQYKAEQILLAKPELDTVVTNLNSNLVG